MSKRTWTRAWIRATLPLAVTLVGGGASAVAQESVQVAPPTASQLRTMDRRLDRDPSLEPLYVPRWMQSGAYDRPEDRGRPFYGEGWSEDWGTVDVALSDTARFVPTVAGAEYVPDRRPSVQIVLHNGSRNTLRGMSPLWYGEGREDLDELSGYDDQDVPIRGGNGIPDAFDYLLSRMDHHYERGFRRMILHLPAGAVSTSHYDSAQYWPMEDWRRKWFWIEVRRWIEEKKLAGDPVSMGVFMGWKIHRPWRFDMTGAVNPDMSNPVHVAWMHQNIYPWARLGFEEFWFDASGTKAVVDEALDIRSRDVLAGLRHSPTWGPLGRFGGEAIPGDGRLSELHVPSEELLVEAGWMAIPLFIESRFGDVLEMTQGEPLFDPHTTEATCWVKNSNRTGTEGESGSWQDGYSIAYYEALRDQGMLFRVHEGRMSSTYDYRSYVESEFVQRLLGFGKITAPVDFDGDGFIELRRGANGLYEGEDWDKFFAAVQRTLRHGGSGYFAGDLNNDGVFDNGDLMLFRRLADDWLGGGSIGSSSDGVLGAPTAGGVVTPLDLGEPWWLP